MTRLRQPERQVLDTLVDAGVARSRSDALAWSVRLVGQHADDWLGQLREAMSEVDKLRSDGPGSEAGTTTPSTAGPWASLGSEPDQHLAGVAAAMQVQERLDRLVEAFAHVSRAVILPSASHGPTVR